MCRIPYWLVWLPLLAAAPSYAQSTAGDTSAHRMVLITASYAHQFPGGDLADRFGHNSNLGLSVVRRTGSDWLLGVKGSFLFGNKVTEPGIIANVINSAGQVVDQDGAMADILLFQRGWNSFLTVGRMFPTLRSKGRSGTTAELGVGYLRHKVRVQTQKNVVPQLEDDYLRGYDRLTAGPAALLQLGYQYLSPRRRANFHVALEFVAGFTEPLRAFNFDTETYNRSGRLDILTGLRIGWTLPIDRSEDERYFLY
ncbi:MAG: hypothetical protein R2817_10600 [Flavobacteriales bacterium]